MAGKDNNAGEVLLTDVRLSFANLFERAEDRKNDDDEIVQGKYGANFLIDKDSAAGKALLKAIKKAGEEARTKKWGDNPEKWPKLKPEKLCLRDGDLEDYDGYEGMFYLSANSDRQPQIITNRKDKDKKWITAVAGQAGAPYSGCRVNALVRLWAQDNKYGKRLNASVEVVQFLKDDAPFGAAPVDPNERFSEDLVGDVGSIGDEEDNDDLV